jgi:GntR family transcriptional regulator, trigonelline degradation regulator
METKIQKLIDNPNLRSQTYKILKSMIITREILPGKKISEETLAQGIGVSRTPIREALFRLEHEGIVKIIPRRGAFVVKPSRENIIEILQVREVLEALIVRLVTPLLDESDIRELRSCLERLRATPEEERHVLEYNDSELEFHELLRRKCPNQMLQRMMGMVNARLQIIRLRTVVLPGRAQKTLDEHAAILKMIEKGNAEKAEQLMRRHVISVRTMALKNIDAML